MKYVITGYTGFLGRNMLEFLRKDPKNTFMLIGRDLSVIDGIADFKPDYILHFAAEIYDESKMIESNIVLTNRLLSASIGLNLKKFIYIGSSSEYGYKNHAMSESDRLEPRNMYEATKGACTLLCQSYHITHGIPAITIRPFSVYGRYEPAHRFIPTLYRKFKNREPVDLYPGAHDFIYVDDFINAVYTILNSRVKNDIVNVGSGIQYTNHQVLEIFEQMFGYSVPVYGHQIKLRSFDSKNWLADTTNAEIEYNIKPKYSLKEGIQKEFNERTN